VSLRRANLAKAIYDLGKLAFAALVLGPVMAAGAFHVWVFVAGCISAGTAFVTSSRQNITGRMSQKN